jgi:hypothetical protein
VSRFLSAALLARGVPADTPSEYGACPSHLAAEEGHPRVLEVTNRIYIHKYM